MEKLSLIIVFLILLCILVATAIYMIVTIEKRMTAVEDKVNGLTTNIGCLNTNLKSFISDTIKYFTGFNDALVKEYKVLKEMNDVHKTSAEHICNAVDIITAKPKKKTAKVNTETL